MNIKRLFHLQAFLLLIGTTSAFAQDEKAVLPTAVEFFQKAEAALNTSKNRPGAISYVAFAAMRAGDVEKAQSYAQEALSYAKEASRIQGEQAYYGNEVMGWVLLSRGDLAGAKYYLLQAGKSTGSSAISKFGPNMILAKALFEAGDRDSVIEFINLCKAIWPAGSETLNKWDVLARAGIKPDFERYVVVAP